MTAKEYLKRFTTLIRQSLKGKGLLTSVVMAHALYESANDDGYLGASPLAKEYNNDMRIKADKTWNGHRILAPLRKTAEESTPRKAWFRVYASSDDSITDRIDMLLSKVTNWPRAVLYRDTVRMQATMLQMLCGPNDEHYSNRIVMLVDKFNLHWYDRQWIIEKVVSNLLLFAIIRLFVYVLPLWDMIFHAK